MKAIENVYLEMHKSYFSTCHVFSLSTLSSFFKNLCLCQRFTI